VTCDLPKIGIGTQKLGVEFNATASDDAIDSASHRHSLLTQEAKQYGRFDMSLDARFSHLRHR
jgi:hypothetical protein